MRLHGDQPINGATVMKLVPLPVLLALAAALACSSDEPTSPRSNRLASQLADLADSASGETDGRIGFALYSASAVVSAGGRVSTVSIELDDESQRFQAVAFRMSFSPAVCQQMYGGGGIREGEFDALCAPMQSLVAWQGDPVRRVVVVQSDTGASRLDSESWSGSWGFWAELYDRESRADWWVTSGTQYAGLVRDHGPCAGRPEPTYGMEVECRLVTLSNAFDLVMAEFIWGDGIFPSGDSLIRGDTIIRTDTIIRGDSTIRGDTVIVVDTGIVIFPRDSVFTPPVSHTMRMASRSIAGLSMTITRIDMGRMERRSLPMAARLSAARR